MDMTLTIADRVEVPRNPLTCLEDLYDEQGASMYRWVLGMLGRREDAEDAVQAVWVNLARRPERLAMVQDLPAYAWTVLRNHVNSLLRRRLLERLWTPPLEIDEEVLQIAPEVCADDRRDLLRAVQRLRPRFREVILLVGFEGCTIEETARRLGVPRGTAASRYHTALENLRARLVERR